MSAIMRCRLIVVLLYARYKEVSVNRGLVKCPLYGGVR